MLNRILCILLVAALWPALVVAGHVDGAVLQAPTVQPSAKGRDRFAVGPGALLRITVPDRAEITNTYRVGPAGTVLLPQLGDVSVVGLSLREISSALAARLAAQGSKPPTVRVEFDKSLQSVIVSGQVRSPGLVIMKGPLSLMKVLAQAGSPTSGASDVLVVIHDEFAGGADGANTSETRTQVDVKNLQAGHDILLHDGDTVFVPKAQLFYILGEVRHQGVYVLDPGMTITQAIALGGGLTDRGSDRGIKIIRSVDGKAVEVDAEPSRVIQADDTVQVRTRRF